MPNNFMPNSMRGIIPPALHYPAYRAYWLGLLASVSGYQMFRLGQGWLIYEITGSAVYLGIFLGLVTALPGMVFNLLGGVVADKLDKRRLVMITQLTNGSLIFLLATLTLLDLVEWWHVLAVAFISGSVEAFDTPARQALYPHLIDRKDMMSAVAMNSSIWQGTRIIAPAIAGFIIDLTHTYVSFFVSGVGFFVLAAVLLKLKVTHIPKGGTGTPVQDLVEGLNYIKGNSIFSFLIGMTFFNSFFGMAYVILMPVFAVDILDEGARGQGLLLGVSGAGALITTLWLGSRSNVQYKGLLIVGGAVVFGLLLAAFALTAELVGSFALAMTIIFFMGVANSTYMISIQTSLQMMVPDRLRGRVMGFWGMTWSIMPLGGVQAGAMAQLIQVPFAVMTGGLAVAAFAIGPAMLNSKIRNLGALLRQAEESLASRGQDRTAAPARVNP